MKHWMLEEPQKYSEVKLKVLEEILESRQERSNDMITMKDLEDMGYFETLDMYNPEEDQQTPLEMVEEYRVTAGQEKLQNWYSQAYKKFTLISEEYEEVKDAVNEEDCLKELADLVYVTYGYADAFGWNLDEALRRVHKNNMGRMYQEDGTIKRREDGKVIKRPGYPKVDLSDLV